ncbi:hypothetical protein [Streptomyces sp. 21So2-11]|uniref:hypothetical protein n=1 Tax=Streptomyces sp. 21So2-11 TaxID=3144408 RepID=UPI00321B158E
MDLQEFRQLLGDALSEGGSQPLLRLTDEEIAILDPDSLIECVAPTPHLEKLSAQEREWAYATALRSLVSRQAVEIDNIEELDALVRSAESSTSENATTEQPARGQVDVDMRITPEVSLALTLRRTAGRALAVEQQTSRGAAHAFVYIHAEDLYLVERITSGGLHMFTLANHADDVAELVQLFVDPFDVADKDGRTQKLTPGQLDEDNLGGPLSEAINNAMVVGQLVLLSDAPGPLLTTYATDEKVWTVLVEKPDAPTGIEARPVGSSTLRRMILRLISPTDA